MERLGYRFVSIAIIGADNQAASRGEFSPSIKRQLMCGTLKTARLKAVPSNMPKAVHISALLHQQTKTSNSNRLASGYSSLRTPRHDKGAPDSSRCILGSINGYRRRLGSHANAH